MSKGIALNTQEIIEKLKQFIIKELIRDPSIKLEEDTPIVSSGLIGSFSIMEIALFIESEFGIFIPNGDLTIDNMDTLAKIAQMALQRQ